MNIMNNIEEIIINDIVIGLKFSTCFSKYKEVFKVLDKYKSLIYLDILIARKYVGHRFSSRKFKKFALYLNKTNVKSVSFKFCGTAYEFHAKQWTNKFIVDSMNDIMLECFQNNNVISHVTIDDSKCIPTVEIILQKNKNYMLMLLLCIDKRIIPKCVMMNCILPYVFDK